MVLLEVQLAARTRVVEARNDRALGQEILEGAELSDKVQDMMEKTCSSQVHHYLSQEPVEEAVEAGGELTEGYEPVRELENWLRSSYGLELDFQLDDKKNQLGHADEIRAGGEPMFLGDAS